MTFQGLSKGDKNYSSVTDLMVGRSSGRTIKMRMNLEDQGALMNKLTDMYDKPITASVREVLSNAIDATVSLMSKGHKVNPVEVSMPSVMSPEFVVTDHGIGMSEDDIENHFAVFGGSEKKSDFQQIGAYGLGAKSPLAYCDQFSFETTKDGVTCKVLVIRSERGPETQILSVENTGNESGTTVRIPLNSSDGSDQAIDISSFNQAIQSYKDFSFDVPVVINGVEYFGNPNYIELGTVEIESDSNTQGRFWITHECLLKVLGETGYYSRFSNIHSYVLSGYRYDSVMSSPYVESKDVIVELKPGVVDFISSRDGITKNNRSIALDNHINDVLNNKKEFILNGTISGIKAGKFSKYETYKIFEALNPQISSDEDKVTIENEIFDFSDFDSPDGYNFLKENAKFSHESIHSVLRVNESSTYSNSRNILTPVKSGNFSTYFKAPYNYSGKVNDLINDVITNLNLSDREDNRSVRLVDCARVVNESSGEIYFVSGMNNEKDIKAVIRQRKEIASSRESTLIIMTQDDKFSDEEIEAFLNKVDSDIHSKINWVDVEFFKKIAKEKRNNSVSVSKDSTPYARIWAFSDGFDSSEEIVNGEVKDSSKKNNSYLGKTDLNTVYGENALIIASEGGSSRNVVFDLLNGYQHIKGFDALKNRPVYVVAQLLKNSVLSLVNSGEEVIRDKSIRHASKDAEEKLNSLPTYSRSVEDDRLNLASDESLIAKYVQSKLGGYCDTVNQRLQSLASFGSDSNSVENIDKMKNFIDSVDYKSNLLQVPEVSVEYIATRGGLDGLIRKVEILEKVSMMGRYSYDQKIKEFVSSMALLLNMKEGESAIPDYLKQSLVKFINDELAL